MIYLNDIDKCAQAWLAQLYPDATIDTRSIADVRSDDLVGFRRVHFFAGIGGWEYALHLAGVPADMPIWTGSCPCQPFSVAGKGKGEADERHLWPEFRRLISECLPPVVFGEQVASKAGREWLTRVRADLEALGYAVGSADLCAAGEGAPHIRQRLYWGAVRLSDTQRYGLRISGGPTAIESNQRGDRQIPRRLSLTDRERRDGLNPLLRPWRPGETDPEAARSGAVGGLPNTKRDAGESRRAPDRPNEGVTEARTGTHAESGRCGVSGFWSDYDILPFTDRKARRTEPGTFPLVDGLPRGVGYSGDPRLPEYAKATAEARVMRLRGYGNAIVPQVAATFIRAFMESI